MSMLVLILNELEITLTMFDQVCFQTFFHRNVDIYSLAWTMDMKNGEYFSSSNLLILQNTLGVAKNEPFPIPHSFLLFKLEKRFKHFIVQFLFTKHIDNTRRL